MSGSLSFPYDIQGDDFSNFSNRDLESDGSHGLVNALSNAKRAIDCQVDAILKTFKIKKKRGFPGKVEQFNELGLVAPRILNRVIRQRNYLEHEYVLPDRERVEDAVDTATLFVAVTNRIYRMFPQEISIGEGDEMGGIIQYDHNCMNLSFDEKNGKISVKGYFEGEDVLSESYSSENREYILLLRLIVESDFHYSTVTEEQAINTFIANVRENL